MTSSAQTLLQDGEPNAVTILQADGDSPYVLVCDHASARLPQSLDTLGLNEGDRVSHAAWDIGAAGVSRLLALRLEAPLALQNYSRLVIDCNRPLNSPDSIPRRTEWNEISGNMALSHADIVARRTLEIGRAHV